MKYILLLLGFQIVASYSYSQQITYKELQRDWYAKFNSEVAPLNCDTLILYPQVNGYMIEGYYYSIFNNKKNNVYLNNDVNHLGRSLPETSPVITERWILKKNNVVKIKIVKKGYLKNSKSLYYKYVPVYDKNKVNKLILIKQEKP